MDLDTRLISSFVQINPCFISASTFLSAAIYILLCCLMVLDAIIPLNHCTLMVQDFCERTAPGLYFGVYCLRFRDHMPGTRSRMTGRSSRRPASIAKLNTSLEKFENPAKVDIGPTPARPGPILLSVAATAVKLVTRSLPSIVTSNRQTTKTIK